MAGTALVVITNPVHLVRQNLSKLLTVVAGRVSDRVYVKFEPELKTLWPLTYGHPWLLTSANVTKVGHMVNQVYFNATKSCNALDVRVVIGNLKDRTAGTLHTKSPVELVVFDAAFSREEMLAYVSHLVPNR